MLIFLTRKAGLIANPVVYIYVVNNSTVLDCPMFTIRLGRQQVADNLVMEDRLVFIWLHLFI